MKRSHILNTLKILISLVLLGFIFSSLDRQAFLHVVEQAHPGWLLAALVMVLVGVVIRRLGAQHGVTARGLRSPSRGLGRRGGAGEKRGFIFPIPPEARVRAADPLLYFTGGAD